MKSIIKQEVLTGERALYHARSVEVVDSTFTDGESPLKEGEDIAVSGCFFKYRYPLWYCKRVDVVDSMFIGDSRAGMWYTEDLSMKNCTVKSPKNFRRCTRVSLEDCTISNAQETFWACRDVKLHDVTVVGDYFCMNSEGLVIDKLSLDGKYSFDGAKNVLIENSRLITKDAFWNCENVTVRNSHIIGEYLAWNSKNIVFENCTIESDQGLCYLDGVKLVNCKMLNTPLAFEFAAGVDAEVTTKIDSVKNPISGSIRAKAIGELILDGALIDPEKTEITTEEGK